MPQHPILLENGLYCTGNDLLTFISVGKLLTSAVRYDEVLSLILDKVREMVPAGNWSLLMADEETGDLTFTLVEGEKSERIRGMKLAPGEGVAGHCAISGEPELIENVSGDPHFNSKFDGITGFSTESIAAIPLLGRGRTVGVLEIVNIKEIDAFKTERLPLLTILADYAAIAIQNARNLEKIERLSITDEYTGLFNARYLYRVLGGACARAGKGGPGFAVVFADVDNFKDVVDSFGHMAGSMALREIGAVMASFIGESDILAKYGGDEYVMVLSGKDGKGALDVCEKIRGGLSETSVLPKLGGVKVTLSFGVAVYGPDGSSREELLGAADRRMFGIKRGSKNGVAA